MKIRTKTELLDRIDKDSVWRKREIINLQGTVLRNTNNKKVMPILKSLVLVSYSHWEGFVKATSSFYLSFLQVQSFPSNQLSVRLLSSLYFWNDQKKPKKAQDSISRYEDLIKGNQREFSFYIDDMCSTESNLNYDVLSKIMSSIGLDSTSFLLEKPFIDERLLKFRNKFAHGDYSYDGEMNINEAIEISKKVLELMTMFKTELENAIVSESFRRSHPAHHGVDL